jgi:hypothetical protein
MSEALFTTLDISLAEAKNQFRKLEEDKVKVSATRARKSLSNIAKLTKELRKLALDTQKSIVKEPKTSNEGKARKVKPSAQKMDDNAESESE